MGITNPKLARAKGAQPYILAQSAVASSALTGTVAETTKATILVPGGTLGPNDGLRIWALFGQTVSTGAGIFRVKFAGNAIGGAAGIAGTRSMEIVRHLWNRNATNSQAVRDDGVIATGSTVLVTSLAVNTLVDQNITLTIQPGAVGDSSTVEAYVVEVLPAP